MTHAQPRRLRRALPLAVGLALFLGGCEESRTAVPETVSDTSQPATIKQVPEAKFRRLKETSFVRSWDLQLGSAVERSWISPAVPELVFFEVAKDHSVAAVDTMSGATRWVTMALPRVLLQPPWVTRTPLRDQNGTIYFDDRLYLISEDTLYCFDLGSGQVIWRLILPFSPATGPMAVGSEGDLRCYIGDTEGRVRVITQHPGGGAPFEIWQWNLLTDLNAQPNTFQNLVYVGDHSGKLRCFALDRDQKWAFEGGGLILGSPAVRDRVVFFGNTDNIVYAINRLTGEKYGQLNLNGQIKRAPFCFGGEPSRLYVWVDHEDARVAGLYAIRTEPGTISFPDNTADHPHPPLQVERMGLEWHCPGVSRLIGSTPMHLFMTFPDSTTLLAVRRDSGEIEWAWNLNEERAKDRPIAFVTEYQDPADGDRTIYTSDEDGNVIAYRFFGYVPPSPEAPPPGAAEHAGVGSLKVGSKPAKAAAPAAGDAAAPAAPAAGDAAAPGSDSKDKDKDK